MCESMGAPLVPTRTYKKEWRDVWSTWKESLCGRLSTREVTPWHMKCFSVEMHIQKRYAKSAYNYEKENRTDFNRSEFGTTITATADSSYKLKNIANHSVRYTGITLDLVADGGYAKHTFRRLLELVDQLATMGFNTLQVRIVSDHGFALSLHRRWQLSSFTSDHVYNMRHVQNLTAHAASRGIEIMPELSVIHRAGGWINAAPVAPCAREYCEGGGTFALNTGDLSILPTLGVVLRELRKWFTSPFVHLGYDEREESLACTNATRLDADFDEFEEKIIDVLEHENVPLDNVLRWDNAEQKSYSTRAGNMTHFRVGLPSSDDVGEDFFISTGLNLDNPTSKLVNAWDIYVHVQKMVSFNPLGIIAPVTVFRDEILLALNIHQRLLAVAIGLSTDNLVESDFRKVFEELCKESKGTQCSRFGTVTSPEKATELILAQSTQRRQAMCSKNVLSMTKAFPLEGVLVANGTDPRKMGVALEHRELRTKLSRLCPRNDL